MSYANDTVGADQLDKGVRDRALGVALVVSLDVAKVTHVASLVRGGAVGFVVRVDYRGDILTLLMDSEQGRRSC